MYWVTGYIFSDFEPLYFGGHRANHFFDVFILHKARLNCSVNFQDHKYFVSKFVMGSTSADVMPCNLTKLLQNVPILRVSYDTSASCCTRIYTEARIHIFWMTPKPKKMGAHSNERQISSNLNIKHKFYYMLLSWFICYMSKFSYQYRNSHYKDETTLQLSYLYNGNPTPHDDVIEWKHFPRYWPFVRGIHRSPVNSPHKGQWRGAWMFSLICARINSWVNNGEAGDLRRHRSHYDVIVMPRWAPGWSANQTSRKFHVLMMIAVHTVLRMWNIDWVSSSKGKIRKFQSVQKSEECWYGLGNNQILRKVRETSGTSHYPQAMKLELNKNQKTDCLTRIFGCVKVVIMQKPLKLQYIDWLLYALYQTTVLLVVVHDS